MKIKLSLEFFVLILFWTLQLIQICFGVIGKYGDYNLAFWLFVNTVFLMYIFREETR